MGKKSKPSKGKKKSSYIMAVLLALLSVFLAGPATQAADMPSLSFAEPYTDHGLYGSLNLAKGNVKNRGGGVNTVYGPFMAMQSGDNRIFSLMLSFGGTIGPSATATDQSTGASIGIGPCVMNDLVCLHPGYKVDFTTGDRYRQLMFLGRVMQF